MTVKEAVEIVEELLEIMGTYDVLYPHEELAIRTLINTALEKELNEN